MVLSDKQLKDVCMLWGGDYRTCRYLRDDDQDYGKYYCYKLRATEKKKIDLKVREFLRDCKKKKIDPATQNVPLGDNCSGYPILKVIQQGYDCDP